MVMMESGVWTTLEVDGGVVDLKAERVDDRTGMMTNVIIRERIEDRGGRGIVVSRVSSARAGWWEKNPDKNTKTLSLVESTKLSSEEKGQETVTSARVARRNFPLRASVVRAPARGPREKTSWELWAEIRDFRKRGVPAYYQRVELHKKFSIPFACLAFALLAAPLGIAVKRGGKGAGLVNGVFIIFGYYIFLTMGEQLGKNAKVHEFFLAGRSAVAEGWWIGGAVCMISSWLPNLLFGGAGAFAVHRATGRLKREIRFLDVIQERIERFAAKYIDHREDAGGGAP
jgi:lipopolysaccharide export LptBFGC system permease protein LptF